MKKAICIGCAMVVVVVSLGSAAMAGPVYVESFGSQGAADGQFETPYGIAVDTDGNVYVADSGNDRLQKFVPSAGTLSHVWSYGSRGTGDGEFRSPSGVDVDSAGDIYVADTENHRAQKFTPSGGTLSHVWSYGSYGYRYGEFRNPYAIAVRSNGTVYVADYGNDCIDHLSQSNGSVRWDRRDGDPGGTSPIPRPRGVAAKPSGGFYVVSNGVTDMSSRGTADVPASGVDVDSVGNVYVAGGYGFHKFSRSGIGLSREWSVENRGSAAGQFDGPDDIAIDSVGNVYVADTWNNRIQRWFDVETLPVGQTVTFANLAVWSDANLGDSLTLESGKTVEVVGTTTIESGATLVLNGGTVVTSNLTVSGVLDFRAGTLEMSGGSMVAPDGLAIPAHGTLRGVGNVNIPVSGQPGSAIVADGNLTLGDTTRYDAFNHGGTLSVGANTVILEAKAFANLGVLTTLAGGTLVADNGIGLGVGDNLAGSGTVNAKVSAGFASTIEATGPLSLGDANAYDGFFSDGSLLTGSHAVTINDRNAAVLGSLTQLGDGVDGGTLTAGNADPADEQAHFLLEQGKNMVGRGSVNGNYKNHGDVISDGPDPGQRLVFEEGWTVTGKGSFVYPWFQGTYNPGDSPAQTTNTGMMISGTLVIDIGGATPGSGDDNHDQINDTATILLSGSPMLEILPWNNFVPEVGDEFVILTWQDGLDGEFGDVIVDSWFTDNGLDFEPHYNNIGGAGNLTIEATPEPATLSLLALGGLAVLRRRSHRRRRLVRRRLVGSKLKRRLETRGLQVTSTGKGLTLIHISQAFTFTRISSVLQYAKSGRQAR